MRCIKFLVLIFLVFALSKNLRSQSEELVYPTPIGGYENIRDSLEYPVLFRNAGIESALRVTLKIDTLGNVANINFEPLFHDHFTKHDSLLIIFVEEKLAKIKWASTKWRGKKISTEIKLPIIFMLTHNQKQNYDAFKHNKPYYKKFESEPIIIIEQKPYIYDD